MKPKVPHHYWNHINGWLLALPAVVMIGLFTHYPIGSTIYHSFTSTGTAVRPSAFIGLENFTYLAERHPDITVRIPLIKNITDTSDNISAIERFVCSVRPDIPIERLEYNPLTPNKYRRLEKEVPCS